MSQTRLAADIAKFSHFVFRKKTFLCMKCNYSKNVRKFHQSKEQKVIRISNSYACDISMEIE